MNGFVLYNVKRNKTLTRKEIVNKGYRNISDGIRTKTYRIGPYTPQYLKNYGFSEKAVKYLSYRFLSRPLDHYRITDGHVKLPLKKGFDVNAFLTEQFFYETRPNFTNEELKVLPILNKYAKQIKKSKMNKQIDNLINLTDRVELKNAITYDKYKKIEHLTDAYVIKQDWMAGDRHFYKFSTLKRLLNNATHISEKAKSPYTRMEFTSSDIVPLKSFINSNYNGKMELMFNMIKNKANTIKQIKSFYNS